MTRRKKSNLERAGAKIVTLQEFLNLSDEEVALIELRFTLSQYVKSRRLHLKFTQFELAKMLGTSQAHVVKIEFADPTVSIDQMITALLKLGATLGDIGKAVCNIKIRRSRRICSRS